MRCDLHPYKHARRRCDHCGARMCKECRSYDRGRLLCPLCARAVDGGFAAPSYTAYGLARVDRAVSDHEPSPLLAAVLSMVVPGLGQVYNGRLAKGVLVFLTAWLVLPWIFGVVDAAAEASRRARRYRAARYALGGGAPAGLPAWNGAAAVAAAAAPRPVAVGNGRKVGGDALKQELLQAAARKGGEISVTEGVLETGATFDDVQKALDALLYKGVVDVDNRPGSGVVVYRFHELAGRPPAQ
jgi:hypothetical protein